MSLKPIIPKSTHRPEAQLKFDGECLVIKTAINRQHVFIDRRMGVTWPSAENEGYFAVYGLLDTKHYPVTLLAERQAFPTLSDMIQRLYNTALKYGCSGIYADRADMWAPVEQEIVKYQRRLSPDAPGIYDSSDWSSIDKAVPIIEAKNAKYAIVIPEGTLVDGEAMKLRRDSLHSQDRVQPWQRYPAYNALAQCICSWEQFPYVPRREREEYAEEVYY